MCTIFETNIVMDRCNIENRTTEMIVESKRTTFLVGLHFNMNSRVTLADKMKKMVRQDVEDDKTNCSTLSFV